MTAAVCRDIHATSVYKTSAPCSLCPVAPPLPPLLCLGWSFMRKSRLRTSIFPVLPCPESYRLVLHPPGRSSLCCRHERCFSPLTEDASQNLAYFPKAIPLIIHVEWKPEAFLNYYCLSLAGKLVTGSAPLKSPAKDSQIAFIARKSENKKSLLI